MQNLFGLGSPLQFPLLQAPMAGVQGNKLAIACAQAGALGAIPCAMLSPQAMLEEMQAFAQAMPDAPLNVNFFCHQNPTPDEVALAQWRDLLAPYYSELGLALDAPNTAPARLPFSKEALEVLRVTKPAVVSFHFGLPAEDLLAQVRALGCKIISSATTVNEARWLAARGVDAVIAQGLEAGGHRGMFLSEDLHLQSGSFALLPQIVRAVQCPVVAAGGIADAQGVRAALALGAAGVQIGSSYLLCPESNTSSVHRHALISPTAGDTAITRLFSGRPARGIINRLMRELGPLNPLAPDFPLASIALAPLRAAAERTGSGDFSPLWAGQNLSGCKAISATILSRELMGMLPA